MNFEEFLGHYLGDGCILYNKEKSIYALELSGNVIEQKEYFTTILHFLTKISGCTPKIRVKNSRTGQSLCLRIDNKQFVEYLIFKKNLPYTNKTFTANIPFNYLPWKKSKHIIRGLFEADGSLYFSQSKK